jgi:hypothetical protein
VAPDVCLLYDYKIELAGVQFQLPYLIKDINKVNTIIAVVLDRRHCVDAKSPHAAGFDEQLDCLSVPFRLRFANRRDNDRATGFVSLHGYSLLENGASLN